MTTLPTITSDSDDQFNNSYSIYCCDPFEFQPISIQLIEQLARELGAQGVVIVDTEMSSGKQGRYLTADSFTALQDKINEKEEDKDYLAEGYGAYMLDISSPLFYKGYPKLFWENYQFDDINNEDEWGEVCYNAPTL